MTAREFYELPEGPPWFQLVHGELFMSPSPDRFHQDIVGNLLWILANHVRSTGCGKLYSGPSDVELSPDDVYEPDLYYVSNERAAILTEHGAVGAPDLVIEVLSPGTARLDLVGKRIVYAQAGVQEMWIVRPTERRVEVWRFAVNPSEPIAALSENDTLTSPLFKLLEIPVTEIFQR